MKNKIEKEININITNIDKNKDNVKEKDINKENQDNNTSHFKNKIEKEINKNIKTEDTINTTNKLTNIIKNSFIQDNKNNEIIMKYDIEDIKKLSNEEKLNMIIDTNTDIDNTARILKYFKLSSIKRNFIIKLIEDCEFKIPKQDIGTIRSNFLGIKSTISN